MKQSEAMTGARGQIVWIAALVISTASIIYLERLDIGLSPGSARGLQSEVQTSAAVQALVLAEARFQAAPTDPQVAAALIQALSVAVLAGALDAAEARTRTEDLRDLAAVGAPDWPAVSVLADIAFGE